MNIFGKLSAIKEDFFEYLLFDCGNYLCTLAVCNWDVASGVVNACIVS